MHCDRWPLAVCTWSLRTDISGVVAAVQALGLDHVNLALRPALAEGGDEYLTVVRRQKWTISETTIGFPQEDYTTLETIRETGGIVPDEYWPGNRDIVIRAADITKELGVPYLSLHAGFIEENDLARAKTIRDRMTELADEAAERKITLLMETGQETGGKPERLSGRGRPSGTGGEPRPGQHGVVRQGRSGGGGSLPRSLDQARAREGRPPDEAARPVEARKCRGVRAT